MTLYQLYSGERIINKFFISQKDHLLIIPKMDGHYIHFFDTNLEDDTVPTWVRR